VRQELPLLDAAVEYRTNLCEFPAAIEVASDLREMAHGSIRRCHDRRPIVANRESLAVEELCPDPARRRSGEERLCETSDLLLIPRPDQQQ
jgi:hypothetical protein